MLLLSKKIQGFAQCTSILNTDGTTTDLKHVRETCAHTICQNNTEKWKNNKASLS